MRFASQWYRVCERRLWILGACAGVLTCTDALRTRGTSDFLQGDQQTQSVKTQCRLHAFSQRSIAEWNNLPDDVESSSSLHCIQSKFGKSLGIKKRKDKYNPEQSSFCPCSH